MVLALFALALATCPLPGAAAPRAHDVAADGSAWLLLAGPDGTCWWEVDDAGDERVIAQWAAGGATRAVALAALPDGRAALVIEDAAGWRLVVRDRHGRQERLPVALPGPPDRVAAHPGRPLLAVRTLPDRGVARVLLVDLDAARVIASVAVSASRDGLHFAPGDDRLYLGGDPELALGPDGLDVAP